MGGGRLRLVAAGGGPPAPVPGDCAVIAHVLGRPEDVPRLAGVARALAAVGAFDQLVVDATRGPAAARAMARLDVQAAIRRPAVAGDSDAQRLGGLLEALDGAFGEAPVTAVTLHGDDEAALAGAVAAARRRLPLVHVGGRTAGGRAGLIARLADLVLVAGEQEVGLLVRRGVPPERIQVVGDPLADWLRRARTAPAARGARRRAGVAPGCYALALLDGPAAPPRLAGALAALAARTPTIVALSTTVAAAWREAGALARLAASPARLVPAGLAERLSLMSAAGVLITDSAAVREAAAVLGTACHDTRYGDPAAIAALRPRPAPRVVGISATRAGARIAEIMVENFARVRVSGPA
jgi:UDP-N-acetylglucosamine 2-epimerase